MSSWCFFCRSEAPAWSLHAQLCAGEGAPSLFPVPAERGQGLPHPQLRKWHRPPTSHSDETPGRRKGEAAKQRAPEPPVFTHLSFARASMKIWCIFKRDTAIKWRELLVVEQPSPWPVSLITFLGKLLSPKLLTPAETILNICPLCLILSLKPCKKLFTRERELACLKLLNRRPRN
jgi:hypothetical protein